MAGWDRDSGRIGETLAAQWLRRERGFTILAANWRSRRDRRDEIDLVARDGAVLVFVEVKTRRERALVTGRHAVDQRKRRATHRACDNYLLSLPPAVRPASFRFDVVEVSLPDAPVRSHLAIATNGDPVVRHFENVGLFGRRDHR